MNESHPIPGSDVIFTCLYEKNKANPEVDVVRWYKDDTILRFHGLPSYIYPIKDVNADDNGTYSCRVGNAIGLSDVSNQVLLVVSAFCKSITFLSFLLASLTSIKKEDISLTMIIIMLVAGKSMFALN